MTIATRAAPVLGATVIVTAPVPEPAAGLTATQLAPLVAVQPHVVRFAVTVTVLVAPVAAADKVFADSAKAQPAAAWLTV